MFLIRMAFWLALIALVLPTDPKQQEKLRTIAAETVHRAATFCDRNATLCERSAVYWAVFKQKLEFGGRLAYELASEHFLKSPAEETPGREGTSAARADKPRGTLAPADLSPEWRGSGAKRNAQAASGNRPDRSKTTATAQD